MDWFKSLHAQGPKRCIWHHMPLWHQALVSFSIHHGRLYSSTRNRESSWIQASGYVPILKEELDFAQRADFSSWSHGRDVSYNPIKCSHDIHAACKYRHENDMHIMHMFQKVLSKLDYWWANCHEQSHIFPHIPMNSQKNSTCSIPPYSYADVWSPGNVPYT